MTITCYIEFENNLSKVVYTNRILRGTVHLKLTDDTIIRTAYLKIIGKGYVHWTDGMGDDEKSYFGRESNLHLITNLISDSEHHDGIPLKPGTYHYPFENFIHEHLPTSFEGEFGYIRYKACVVVKVKSGRDETFKIPFTVIKKSDLNADPKLQQPILVKKEKKISRCFLICCYRSNPLEIVARTPVSGYTPGQTINLEFTASNKSEQPISGFKVQLVKENTYHERSNGTFKKRVTTVVAEGKTPGCDIDQNDTTLVCIEVPAVPPTDVTSSGLIKVRYFCRIIGSVTGLHFNPVLELPITICSHPIDDLQQQLAIQANTASQDSTSVKRISKTDPIAPHLPDQNGTT